jgi:hypothetical protein
MQTPGVAGSLWNQQGHAATTRILEQAWYAGVHSDLGGGYSDRSLADLTLDRMASRAPVSDLALDGTRLPRAPNPLGLHHQTGGFRLRPVRAGIDSSEVVHRASTSGSNGWLTTRPPTS